MKRVPQFLASQFVVIIEEVSVKERTVAGRTLSRVVSVVREVRGAVAAARVRALSALVCARRWAEPSRFV